MQPSVGEFPSRRITPCAKKKKKRKRNRMSHPHLHNCRWESVCCVCVCVSLRSLISPTERDVSPNSHFNLSISLFHLFAVTLTDACIRVRSFPEHRLGIKGEAEQTRSRQFRGWAAMCAPKGIESPKKKQFSDYSIGANQLGEEGGGCGGEGSNDKRMRLYGIRQDAI